MVELNRIENLLDCPAFLKRVFSERERDLIIDNGNKTRRVELLAGRFAAKEATLKAVGKGIFQGISLRDIETLTGDNGKPSLLLSGRALEITRNLRVFNHSVSISHTKDVAIAFTVLN